MYLIHICLPNKGQLMLVFFRATYRETTIVVSQYLHYCHDYTETEELLKMTSSLVTFDPYSVLSNSFVVFSISLWSSEAEKDKNKCDSITLDSTFISKEWIIRREILLILDRRKWELLLTFCFILLLVHI